MIAFIPRLLALIIACCLVLTTAGHAADRGAEITAIVDRAIRPIMAEHDVPGMAVAITVGGEQHIASYGVASKEGNRQVTPDTLFEIGSISKTLTATLASYAHALGKLSFADTPGKHMPALRGSTIDKASLLHLGTYTGGGLPLQFPDDVTSTAEAVAYFRNWQPSAEPGEQRRYSNPSIGLFGHIAAVSMEGDFAELMQSRIFAPLGLERSFVRVPDAAMGDYAWGHNKAGRPVRVNPGALDAEAYGIKSTATDMIRFVEANMRPESLAAPLRQAIEGTHIGYFRIGGMVQGLGWEQYPYPVALEQLLAGNGPAIVMEPNEAITLTPPRAPSEPTLFNKTGSTGGFGAYVAFVPARRLGIVMLANRNYPVPARIAAAHAMLEQLSRLAP